MSSQSAITHRLAAILFADVVEYTALAARDETLAFAVVEIFQRTAREIVSRFGGTLVKFIGDAVLAEFPSTDGSIRAALRLGEEFEARSRGQCPEGRLRIGVHVGDLLVSSDGDVYGHGVNVAARLQREAQPGQVVVSQLVERQLSARPAFRFTPLGERKLRGVEGMVALFAVTAGPRADWRALPPEPAQPERFRERDCGAAPSTAAPGALPTFATPFVGRAREVEELANLLRTPNARLITVVGPGGMGKTRLAVAAVERFATCFPDGAYYVPLDSVSSSELFLTALADALGLAFYSTEPAAKQIARYLQEKTLLLLLDGFERLVETAALVADLVGGLPGLTVLVTSRERLNVSGEQILSIGGLEATPAREETESPAVQLFLNAARRRRPDLALAADDLAPVRRIAVLVGGMPLGLELAAGWVDVLSVGEIVEELDESSDLLTTERRDVPNRHRSLQAVVASSWKRLTTEEREVLTALAVFRAGFTREAARQVAGASLRILTGLIGKGFLLQEESGRYGIHPVLRSHAEQQCGPEQTHAVRSRHAVYFAGWAREREGGLHGDDSRHTLAVVQAEFENLTRAWRWAAAQGDRALLGSMLGLLHEYCGRRGRHAEGDRLLKEAVEAVRKHDPPGGGGGPPYSALLGRLLGRQGQLALRLGRHAAATRLLSESLEVLQDGTPEDRAFTLNCLGDLSGVLGRYAESRRFCERSLALFREVGDPRGMTASLNNLGVTAHQLRDYTEARKHYEESLSIARSSGDRHTAAFALNNLGVIAHDQQDYPRAEHLYAEAREHAEALGDAHGVATAVANLGRVALARRELGRAVEHSAEARQRFQHLGDLANMVVCDVNLGDAALEGEDPAAAEPRYQSALRRALELHARPLVGEAVIALAAVRAARGSYAGALRALLPTRGCTQLDGEAADRRDQLLEEVVTRLTTEAVERLEQAEPPSLEEVARELLNPNLEEEDGQDP